MAVGAVVVVGSLLTMTPSQAAPPAPSSANGASSVTWGVPAHSGQGRRIVYKQTEPQHVWLVRKSGKVARDFPVSGRTDWPNPGHYAVFSKSPRSWNSTFGVKFRYMVRFTMGNSAAIGFHTIPRSLRTGERVHSPDDLGRALGRGGCPHVKVSNAEFLYAWAHMGTPVIVIR